MESTEILLTVKQHKRGEDGHKVVSVRMNEELVSKLDQLAARTKRSRNEVINILLERAVQVAKLES